MRLDPITLQDKATRVKRDHTTRTNRHFFLFDVRRLTRDERYKLQSDEHSVLEPPLPIPNRTVKRDRANDSAHPCVKVGHRQTHPSNPPEAQSFRGFLFGNTERTTQKLRKAMSIRGAGISPCALLRDLLADFAQSCSPIVFGHWNAEARGVEIE